MIGEIRVRAWILFGCLLAPLAVHAHEGDAETRALRLQGLLLQLDRTWAEAAGANDAAVRDRVLARHGQLMLDAHEALGDVTDGSACILMEARDDARRLACLVDVEARLRATERLLGHALRRLAVPGAR